MKCFLIFALAGLFAACSTSEETGANEDLMDSEARVDVRVEGDVQATVDNALKFAEKQLKAAIEAYPDSGFPRTVNEDGTLRTVKSGDWTSGFFPGSLWYLYGYTGDTIFKSRAVAYMEDLEKEKFNTGTHDLGFMMFCPYGNAMKYDSANFDKYDHIILQATESLCSRYNDHVECIRSWDHGEWSYPVIIDNMMNLEMIWWAYQHHGDERYNTVAINHANKTMQKHFRPDYSSYHVVDYDPQSGLVLDRGTHQGYSDSSAWARGQAWGLYGYTMAYRMTEKPQYLIHAKKIAHFILEHEHYPEDGVPYWDYHDPAIPNTERDASAAAVIASALIELSQIDEANRDYFKEAAEKIIMSLSSTDYIAPYKGNGYFMLKHSVGAKPFDSEVDVPLVYADYYFIEALLRYKEAYMNTSTEAQG